MEDIDTVRNRLLNSLDLHVGLKYPYNSLFYYNRDNKRIRLHWPGFHVKERFKNRLESVKKILKIDFTKYHDLFNWCIYKSERVKEEELTESLKERREKSKKKGMNSLYLEHQSGLFRFVVNHNKIVTFELCGELSMYN